MSAPGWGILGTGSIASSFVEDLSLLDEAEVVAVGSRSATGADGFGERWGISRRYGSYAALVADPQVDVVYVASPHPWHAEHARLAIAAGKHVLVEKPFALNATQAREVLAAARERGVFAMEAMWTRFLPKIVALRRLVDEGVLGDVVAVHAELGRRFPADPSSRLLDPALGGGGLLDLGVYPLSFAHMMLGAPTAVTATSTPAPTGVDGHTSMLLEHGDSRHSLLACSILAAHSNRAVLVGTEARVEIDAEFYRPGVFTVIAADGERTTHDHTDPGIGLRHQAVEVARCIDAGLGGSPLWSHDDTLAVHDTMDDVRRQIGLRYPSE